MDSDLDDVWRSIEALQAQARRLESLVRGTNADLVYRMVELRTDYYDLYQVIAEVRQQMGDVAEALPADESEGDDAK